MKFCCMLRNHGRKISVFIQTEKALGQFALMLINYTFSKSSINTDLDLLFNLFNMPFLRNKSAFFVSETFHKCLFDNAFTSTPFSLFGT